jgi:hypothetical protein
MLGLPNVPGLSCARRAKRHPRQLQAVVGRRPFQRATILPRLAARRQPGVAARHQFDLRSMPRNLRHLNPPQSNPTVNANPPTNPTSRTRATQSRLGRPIHCWVLSTARRSTCSGQPNATRSHKLQGSANGLLSNAASSRFRRTPSRTGTSAEADRPIDARYH